MKVIYDFGAYDGGDLEYYLTKAEKVIAVEANPALCAVIRDKFREAIKDGKLFIENVAISSVDNETQATFYVHTWNDRLSSLKPNRDIGEYQLVTIASKRATEVVAQHGLPYYVKIDLEGCDDVVLCDLFAQGIRPPYISAECSGPETYANLLALGGYRAFKIARGSDSSHRSRSIWVKGVNRGLRSSQVFPQHSAGPFGNDLAGPWLNPKEAMKRLVFEGYSWVDIHATNEIFLGDSTNYRMRNIVLNLLGYLMRVSTNMLVEKVSPGKRR